MFFRQQQYSFLLFFCSKEKPNTVEKWKNNFRVIYNTLTLRVTLATLRVALATLRVALATLRVALIFPPTTVFGFYFFSVLRKMAENPIGFLPHSRNSWRKVPSVEYS